MRRLPLLAPVAVVVAIVFLVFQTQHQHNVGHRPVVLAGTPPPTLACSRVLPVTATRPKAAIITTHAVAPDACTILYWSGYTGKMGYLIWLRWANWGGSEALGTGLEIGDHPRDIPITVHLLATDPAPARCGGGVWYTHLVESDGANVARYVTAHC